MRNPFIPEEILEKYMIRDAQGLNTLLQNNPGKDFRFEIGSGNGHFIMQAAENHPDSIFIGCDIEYNRVKKTIKKLCEKNLTNAYLVFGRGEEILEWIEQGKLSHVYVNFPDPWPKKKHHRRRFFYPSENLQKVLLSLKKQGRLYFVSDHEEYFFFTLNERLKPCEELATPFKMGYDHALENYFSTLYEEKFKKIGKPIYYTYFEKK